MPKSRNLKNFPLKEGAIIQYLGKWCIAPCGQQMISVDFQSAQRKLPLSGLDGYLFYKLYLNIQRWPWL